MPIVHCLLKSPFFHCAMNRLHAALIVYWHKTHLKHNNIEWVLTDGIMQSM